MDKELQEKLADALWISHRDISRLDDVDGKTIIFINIDGYGDRRPTFDMLECVSKLFGGAHVNIRDLRYNPGGCDTCDYGSSTSYYLEIWPWER